MCLYFRAPELNRIIRVFSAQKEQKREKDWFSSRFLFHVWLRTNFWHYSALKWNKQKSVFVVCMMCLVYNVLILMRPRNMYKHIALLRSVKSDRFENGFRISNAPVSPCSLAHYSNDIRKEKGKLSTTMIHATMLQQTSVSISKGSSANYIQSADFSLNTTGKKSCGEATRYCRIFPYENYAAS